MTSEAAVKYCQRDWPRVRRVRCWASARVVRISGRESGEGDASGASAGVVGGSGRESGERDASRALARGVRGSGRETSEGE